MGDDMKVELEDKKQRILQQRHTYMEEFKRDHGFSVTGELASVRLEGGKCVMGCGRHAVIEGHFCCEGCKLSLAHDTSCDVVNPLEMVQTKAVWLTQQAAVPLSVVAAPAKAFQEGITGLGDTIGGMFGGVGRR